MSGGQSLQSQKIYNNLVDEQIELDNPEEVMANVAQVQNQHVDEVHNMTDNSAEDVPSPPGADGDSEDRNNRAGSRLGPGGAGGMGGENVWLNYNPADYQNLNISPEIKDLFKHITK